MTETAKHTVTTVSPGKQTEKDDNLLLINKSGDKKTGIVLQ